MTMAMFLTTLDTKQAYDVQCETRFVAEGLKVETLLLVPLVVRDATSPKSSAHVSDSGAIISEEHTQA